MLIKVNKKQLEKKQRKFINDSELKRRYYKYMKLISLRKQNKIAYINFQSKLNNLPLVRYNNSCYLTNRGRGVLRKYKLSRHQIREKFKYLHGLTNSSW